MPIAFVFPGQGSQAPGMGRDLAQAFSIARETFQEVDDALGEHLSKLMFEGPPDELTMTSNAQPALLAVSLAVVRVLEREGGFILSDRVALVAGHSLGEYSALVAAGSLTLAGALRLTRRRGELMQRAVPPGAGAMSAVMGDPQLVLDVCAATPGTVQPANFNAPTQTVISGERAAVEAAGAELKARGLKVIPLKVSAPFHCALMRPAQVALTPDLHAAAFGPLAFGVVANVTAELNQDPARLPELLAAQITGSVRWVETVRALAELGADTFIEFGPGAVLTGLVRRILPDAQVRNIGKAQDLEAQDPA